MTAAPKRNLRKVFLSDLLHSQALVLCILLKQAILPQRRIKKVSRADGVNSDHPASSRLGSESGRSLNCSQHKRCSVEPSFPDLLLICIMLPGLCGIITFAAALARVTHGLTSMTLRHCRIELGDSQRSNPALATSKSVCRIAQRSD